MIEQKRWRMNRMGFVNFWLYDNEIFPFCDGKLMLRGQNASGKSITTQSFIPFILDGNRSPSRLDPFGSSDRKMEYYFLGNSESDDVTGYLFMEFKKEGIEEYRTIGIGQRARRGKNDMGFWGFIILDGRRIGIDFELTNKIRDKLIPLSKKELSNRLGSQNLMLETQREYMASVNKYLFGFPLIEQYEQFIQLLIKVRAPKLSKEFKPSKVYDILNESLQTLTDDDLHTMVDAMEKMDDIEISLENYRKAYSDVTIIGNEYRKYNNYMLGLKARNYLNAKKEADSIKSEFKNLTDEIKTLEEKIESDKNLHSELDNRIIELDKLIKLWADSDLIKSVGRRDELKSEINKLNSDIGSMDKQIKTHKDKIEEIEQKVHKIEDEIEDRKYDVSKETKELDFLNNTAMLSFHSDVKTLIATSEKIQKNELRNEVSRIKGMILDTGNLIKNGLKKLKFLNEALKKLDIAEKKLYENELALNTAKSTLSVKDQEQISCKDKLIEAWYISQSDNKEYLLNEIEFKSAVEMISLYSENDKPYAYMDYLSKIFHSKNAVLADLKSRIHRETEDLNAKCKQKDKDLEELKSQKEITPIRSEEVQTARKLLSEQGIPFVSLYEAVDFSKNCNDDRKTLLEKQLMMSGLLDSLVVPKVYRERVFDILQNYSDTVICTKKLNSHRCDFLEISQGITDENLRTAINEVLYSIVESYDESAVYILSDSGYFKNGLLEGYAAVEKNDCVRYIGVEARRKLKERLISEKELELEKLKADMEGLKEQKSALENRIKLLGTEYYNSPQIDELDLIVRDLTSLKRNLEVAQKRYDDSEKEHKEALKIKDTANRDVISACSKLPYKRDTETYEEAENMLEDYELSIDKLKDCISDIIDSRYELDSCNNRIDEQNSMIFDIDTILTEKKRDRNIKAVQVQEIDDFLNNPENKKLADEMTRAQAELNYKKSELDRVKQELAGNCSAVKIKSQEVEKISDELKRKDGYFMILKGYFEEELSLELYDSLPDETSRYTSVQLAETALSAMKRIESNFYNSDTAYSTLYEKYQKHSSSIASYGMAFEDRFDSSEFTNIVRKRQVITAVWEGVRYSLEEFTARIKNAVESTELLIQQKDRVLFEDILSETISRKLTARISESREWIADMSQLMQDMDTSMGLTFSLQWKPRKAEGGGQLGTQELEKLLTRDKELLPLADRERLAYHFRAKIRAAKQEAAENGKTTNYLEMVRDALDYRKWFEFKMFFRRTSEGKNELTDRAFNRFSGGEKAMAMYIPLFAAVNAQYRKSKKADYPRIIALDEAFAGVDDKNISSMFKLVETLEFDYIMNSQALWGCYETVKSLRIAELLRPENSQFITVIFYHWNGKKKILDE